MIKIPKISKLLQKKYTGQSVAIVDGKIVASGRNSYEAEKNAVRKGYLGDEVMTTHIMSEKPYVL